MKFGVREICDVVFKANQDVKIGNTEFKKGRPVLYIDTAKTSTIEGAATTVYATGGRGNSRLIAWEGEKTLTFTVEDALLSPIGFAVLSGAGLFKGTSNDKFRVHCTAIAEVDSNGVIELEDVVAKDAPIFVAAYVNGSLDAMLTSVTVQIGAYNGGTKGNEWAEASTDATDATHTRLTLTDGDKQTYANKQVFVDYYVEKKAAVTELQIDAENFAGYYYVEASTLFRRESDGRDLPAEIIFPRVKIQSNFTFSMASSGDPSTFTFTMDAFPGYTMFEKTKKVLCVMQVIDDTVADKSTVAVTDKVGKDVVEETANDSVNRTVSGS